MRHRIHGFNIVAESQYCVFAEGLVALGVKQTSKKLHTIPTVNKMNHTVERLHGYWKSREQHQRWWNKMGPSLHKEHNKAGKMEAGEASLSLSSLSLLSLICTHVVLGAGNPIKKEMPASIFRLFQLRFKFSVAFCYSWTSVRYRNKGKISRHLYLLQQLIDSPCVRCAFT